MLEGILGKKLGMTRIFSQEGEEIAVTAIKAGPCFVVQRKTREEDGYDSIQLGFIEKKARLVNKPMAGHFKKASTANFYHLREFRGGGLEGYQPGQKIGCADIFKVGGFVDVSGRTKGRGFAGVVKRWSFMGGAKSHGSMFDRAPGSIGASSAPSRVLKGKKLPGHYGNERVSIQNLEIVDIKPEEDIILIRGAVPGSVNGVVEIRKAVKK
ncbi:MAG: 50S ribosomal protein L3 [Deltaproteobacteria bacterium]|nr:50S ribosomal protein L3 [Deltaproteobacteria bacterium]